MSHAAPGPTLVNTSTSAPYLRPKSQPCDLARDPVHCHDPARRLSTASEFFSHFPAAGSVRDPHLQQLRPVDPTDLYGPDRPASTRPDSSRSSARAPLSRWSHAFRFHQQILDSVRPAQSSGDPPVSISLSFAGVRRRPGPSAQFCRAWSRTAPTAAGRPATELESVLGKPSRVRISYPPPVD